MTEASSLTPADVVYDLEVKSGRPQLTLTAVSTRRKISHDDAVTLGFLPEIFYLLTAPGSRVATWSARTTAMKASAALFDAGIRNIADIDRLQEIAADRAREAKEAQVMKDIRRMVEVAVRSGALLGPTPAPVAAANMSARPHATPSPGR